MLLIYYLYIFNKMRKLITIVTRISSLTYIYLAWYLNIIVNN